MPATYIFYGDLPQLLRRRWRDQLPIHLAVSRRTSIKDQLEAFGLPHTEIGRLLCHGHEIDFSHLVRAGQRFEVYPVVAPWDLSRPTLLRPDRLACPAFLVDPTLGRLARSLRMAGLNTLYQPEWITSDLLRRLRLSRRVLLTCNLDLLKHSEVIFARCIRSEALADQLHEVITLFGISALPQQLVRCLACNALLKPVAKEAVLHRLEPLTIRYYHTFQRCPRCDRIYWAGSHVARMQASLRNALSAASRVGVISTGRAGGDLL